MKIRRACLYLIIMLACKVSIASTDGSKKPTKPDNKVLVIGIIVDLNGRPQSDLEGECVNMADGHSQTWLTGQYYDDHDNTHWGSHKKLYLRLLPGTYRIWAYGAKKYALTFAVPKNKKHVSIKIIGRSGNNALFKVLDPNGKPVINKKIYLAADDGIMTDSRGIAAMSCGDGDYLLTFAVPGVGYTRVSVPDDKLLKASIKVRLQSSGIFVSGKVISSQTGRPLGGIGVVPIRGDNGSNDEWYDWNDFYENTDGPEERFMTLHDAFVGVSRDDDGSFLLGPIPSGKYDLTLATREGKSLGSVPMTLTASHLKTNLVIRTRVDEDAIEFDGRLLSPTRSPLANKEVLVQGKLDILELSPGPGPVIRHTKTDKNGYFTLYPVVPGKYLVDVFCGGYKIRKWMVINAETPTRTFVLKKTSKPRQKNLFRRIS